MPSHSPRPDFKEAIPKLTKDYRLRHHFQNSAETHSKLPPFKKPSTWIPPKANQATENFLEELPAKLDEVAQQPWKRNMNKREWQALRELAKDHDLVVNKADKGSAIIVQDRATYVEQGKRHLANLSIYEEIAADTTKSLSLAINSYIGSIHRRGLLHHAIANYLTLPDNIRTQLIYFLLKIHKNPVDVRPIVSGCEGPTEKISCLLDYFLQPLVQKANSYIRDSKSLIRMLENFVLPDRAILVSIDVKSLYLSIPQDEGISVVIHRLARLDGTDLEPPFPTTVTAELLSIVLKHNIFQFDGSMFRQVRGTAMGTRVAPAFAGIFMADLEESFLEEEEIKPLIWRRYIDDILCIWPDSRDSLDDFLLRLNSFHPTISFTHTISEDSIVYLDLTIYKGQRFAEFGILDLKPFYKTTNSFMYLHRSSSHPSSTFKGTVKGELVRLLRSSSDEDTYNLTKDKILHHFRQRGYREGLLRKAANQVTYPHRSYHLQDRDEKEKPPPLFITHHHQGTNTVELHSAITPSDTSILKPMLVFRKGKSIANHIVRAKLLGSADPPTSEQPIRLFHKPAMKKISAPCGVPLCGCCSSMSKKEQVYDKAGRPHEIAVGTDCSTSRAIYLLECTKCPRARYVGQTARTIRTRMAGHRAASLHKNMPLYVHTRRSSHSFADMKVTILEETSANNLLARELYWMTILGTVIPDGLNSKFSGAES